MFPRLALLSEEDEPDEFLGGAMFVLLDGPEEWIHRRVESARFVDAGSIRRRVSVDLDLPDAEFRLEERRVLVPLALLEKQPLVDLDVQDENGASLPILNADENAFVSWCLLSRVAQQVLTGMADLQGPVPSHILGDLRTIAGDSTERAEAKLATLEDGPDPELRSALTIPIFMEYATWLASRFLLIVEVHDDGRQHRVLKFSYTQPLERASGRRWQRLRAMLGWTPAQFDADAPGVGEAQTYHFEFEAPPGLHIQRAELFTSNLMNDQDEGRQRVGRIVGPRAHIYAASEDLGVDGIASVWLSPSRPGLLRSALATSGIILAVFLFFHWEERITGIQEGLALPLLLTAPALAASFIVRPGEHGLATDLLAGIRGCIGLSALAAYAGAIVVAGGTTAGVLEWAWTALSVVVALCFASLLVAYIVAGTEVSEEETPDGQES